MLLLLAGLGLGRRAQAIWASGEGGFALDGTFRTMPVATINYDQPVLFGDGNRVDGINLSSLRLLSRGRPVSWLSFEAHGVGQLLTTSSTGGLVGGGSGGLFANTGASPPYRATPLDWRFADEGDAQGMLFLDRANVKLSVRRLDVTLGRQAISFGKAYFWNPLDVFRPFGATELDRDYKAGVDAARLDLALGDFSGLTLVGAVGDLTASRPAGTPTLWDDSALLLRAFTTLGEWDLALQGGKVRGGAEVGGGISGELASVAVRAEGTYFWPIAGDVLAAHASGVLGLGHRFESSLNLEAEALYNGGSAPTLAQSFALVAAGRLQQASRYAAGVVASYQLHPLVVGSLALLGAGKSWSGFIQPGITYSAADEVDVVAGVALAVGPRPTGDTPATLAPQSEFGTYPHFAYVQAKLYF